MQTNKTINKSAIIIVLILTMLISGCNQSYDKPEESIFENPIIQEDSLETEGENEGENNENFDNQISNLTERPGDNVAGSSNANYALEETTRDMIRNIDNQEKQTDASRSAASTENNNNNGNNNGNNNSNNSNWYQPQATRPPQIENPTVAPTMPTTMAVPEPTTQAGNGNYAEAEARKVLELVNEARRAQGLSELTWSSSLAASANIRAEEIKVSFSHTRPDGTSFATVNALAKGENIAYGYRQLSTAQEVFQGWMNSQGHRENILRSNFKTLGVGCYVINGTYYWVQLFGN